MLKSFFSADITKLMPLSGGYTRWRGLCLLTIIIIILIMLIICSFLSSTRSCRPLAD